MVLPVLVAFVLMLGVEVDEKLSPPAQPNPVLSRSNRSEPGIRPLYFAGPPQGRTWNASEEELLLRHQMIIVGGGVTNAESAEDSMHAQVLQLQAAAVAAGRVAPPIHVYRNGLESLPGYAAIDAAYANSSLDFLWLRNTSAPGHPICEKNQPNFPGRSRYFDWRDPRVATWFTAAVVEEVAKEDGVAGVFFDEADWGSCGSDGKPSSFFQHTCDPTWTTKDTVAFAEGQARAWTSSYTILSKAPGGPKQMALSLFTARTANGGAIDNYTCVYTEDTYFDTELKLPLTDIIRPYLDVLWFGPSATDDACDHYIQNMIDDALAGATVIARGALPATTETSLATTTTTTTTKTGKEPLTPPSSDRFGNDPDTELQAARAATAAILMADEGRTFVALSSGWDASDTKWWSFYDDPIGTPTSPARVSQHVWQRNFTGGYVVFDCGARPFTGDVVVTTS
eukprot:m.8079 g.8079  ORF g.8079 m.8079 type:complete len:454 (-) comp6473_c0_seq1:62-1423(-)